MNLSIAILPLGLLVTLASCDSLFDKGDKETVCPATTPHKYLDIKEVVGDTLFSADTVYKNNIIAFNADPTLQNAKWNIGGDSRTFTQKSFHLTFSNELASEFSKTITLSANKQSISTCDKYDSLAIKRSKRIVFYENFDTLYNKISPLAGRYIGYFKNSPNNIFTIRIEYFKGARYPSSLFGANSFYWISNIPNGYFWPNSSQTSNFPELQHGRQLTMGYKSFTFDGASCQSGRGWLSHDTLRINYGERNCRRVFIGKRVR